MAYHPEESDAKSTDSNNYIDESYENVPQTQFDLCECENYNLSTYNYDSSTIVSESMVGSSNGHLDNENDFNIKPSIMESGNPVKISVGHSTDVSFGNKTFITGPVVIKNFVTNQKDQRSDLTGTTGIKTTIRERLEHLYNLFKRRPVMIVTIIIIVSIALVASLCAYYLHSPLGVEPFESDDFEFVSREDYDALPRRGELRPLNLPVKYVIIAHTEGDNCTNLEQCKEVARHVQWYHMEIHGWDEIGLNFMVGGDGRVYEGSGYEEGAHTLGYNFDSVCISLIGNFSLYEPRKEQLDTAKKVIKKGVAENYIQSEYVLYAQALIRGGDSPGKFVYDEIVKWPQFSDVILPKS